MRVNSRYLALIFAACTAGCAHQMPQCPPPNVYGHTRSVGDTLRQAEKTGQLQNGHQPTSSLGGAKSGFTVRSIDQSCTP